MLKLIKKMRFFGGIFFTIICLANGVCAKAANAEVSEADSSNARVLFISSYSYAWDTVQIQIEGIQAGLGEGVVLDYEFMDTKRVADDEAMHLFYEGLKYRLEQVDPYDVIILGDDAALVFALTCRDMLFPDTPLVFEGINDTELAMEAAKDPLITGVLEQLSPEKNIEFGLSYNPHATKVVAILDNTITGQAERNRFYSYAKEYPDLEFSEINTSEKTTTELQSALRSLSDDSILIYVVMTEDASGKHYTNEESVQLIAEYASVPALRMVEGGIGQGLLGGNVVSMYKSGEMAAQMAMDIITGTDSGAIDVVADSPNVYCVDEAVMEKFHMKLSLIPEGATVVNHEENFIERNREALIPGLILVGALLVIILWVCFDNVRRRKLLEELEQARGIMETASQHDFLTGLPNRSKFMKDLEKLIDEQVPCTVMMIDIDDFKQINDTYGHTAGDEALQQVAARLKEMQSQILMSYRFAGDEFILILQSAQSKIVEKAAYQCRQLFTKPFTLNGEKKKVCGSIGVATYPKDTQDLEQLIVCADDAMYQVKKSGKNDFAYYVPQKTAGMQTMGAETTGAE